MKDEIVCVAIEELRVKSNMYSYFVDDKSENKKVKGVKKNVIATKGHNEFKGVLLNKKCLIHSMNRIQNKNKNL